MKETKIEFCLEGQKSLEEMLVELIVIKISNLS